ncbi:hypothetical protein [Streptomyces sp. NPDC051000]|uniref:hypothetical protein n=1 Tax=Streptomyces sp. NPDC051000 TaxID=3155520 RepID=UPI003409257F
MTDIRRTVRRESVGSLFGPATRGPRLLARTVTGAIRSARRRRVAGPAAVCATAGEHRSCPGRRGGSGSAVVDPLRCGGDTSPGGAARRERAHEAVASRTTGPDDLASLLNMLDLRTGPDEEGTGP